MPEVLGYAKLSVPEFIQSVERRSSLMILSGHEIEQGTLYPMYEFRHLTFQEYLAARAVVDGYYLNRTDNDTQLTILEPHLADEHWKEVVPLAAVLAGRKVQPLIQHLIDLCKKFPSVTGIEYSKDYPVLLLSQCILDEIQIPPDLLEEGLEWIARRTEGPSMLIQLLYRGRFGKTLQKVVQNAYISSNMDLPELGSALSEITLDQINWTRSQDITPQLVEKIKTFFVNESLIKKAAGALAVMSIAFEFPDIRKESEVATNAKKLLNALGDQLVPILYSDEPYIYFAVCWAFVWLGKSGAWSPEHKPGVLSRLLEIWRESQLYDVQRQAAWAIRALPIIDRELKPLPEPDPDMVDFIKQQYSLMSGKEDIKDSAEIKRSAALVIGFYWKTPWTDEELAQLVVSEYDGRDRQNSVSLLKALGEPGMAQLEVLKEKSSRPRKLKASSKKRIKKSQKRQPKEG
jgi:hypothetical protein